MKTRPIIYSIIVVILIAAGVYTLINNKKKNEAETAIVAQKNTDISVNVTKAKFEHITNDYSSNGTFAPYQELSFPSEISGRIVRVLVDEGSYVRVGQTVATIKKDQLLVDNSNANATYQNAVVDNQRYENAFKTGGVTKQQVDNSRLQVKNARAQLQQANLRIGDTNVRASISGIINKRLIEPGSVVSPGTVMFEIVNVSRLKLKVNVNESQVASMKVGDEIDVKASVYPDAAYKGRISFIAPLADASLNFPVEIEITNSSENNLRAGMYGTAVFNAKESGTAHAMLVLPKNSFVGGVSSNQVFVVQPNNTVKLTTVVIGRIFGDQIEILSGIKEGETVVTTGQINLIDGAKINIVK